MGTCRKSEHFLLPCGLPPESAAQTCRMVLPTSRDPDLEWVLSFQISRKIPYRYAQLLGFLLIPDVQSTTKMSHHSTFPEARAGSHLILILKGSPVSSLPNPIHPCLHVGDTSLLCRAAVYVLGEGHRYGQLDGPKLAYQAPPAAA